MSLQTTPRRRGQATIEFALIAPLFLACTLALVGTAVVCVKIIANHEIARRTARAASMADDPCATARSVVPASHQLRCTLDESASTVTIAVSSRLAVPLLGRVVSEVMPWQEVTMMRVPVPLVG